MPTGLETEHLPLVGEHVEYELLKRCCHAGVTSEQRASVRELAQQDIDWDTFWSLAACHGVGLLAGHTLQSACGDLLPAETNEKLEEEQNTASRRNRFLLRGLKGVLELLAERDIQALTFKGPLLAVSAYGGLGLRFSADLDLLVQSSTMGRVAECLQDSGYVAVDKPPSAYRRWLLQYLKRQITFAPSAPIYTLDVHTRLLPPMYTFDLAFQDLWSRARETSVDGLVFRTMSAEDQLLILCHHGVKNRWRRLKFVADVAACVYSHPELDWSTSVQRARRLKGERTLCLGMYLAHEVLGTSLPNPIRDALLHMDDLKEVAGPILWRYPKPEERGPMDYRERARFYVMVQDTVIARARYVAFSNLRRMMDGVV